MKKKIVGFLILYLSLIFFFDMMNLFKLNLQIVLIIFSLYLMRKRDVKELLKEKLFGAGLLVFIVDLIKKLSYSYLNKKDVYMYLINIFIILGIIEILKRLIIYEKKTGFLEEEKTIKTQVLERYNFTQREKEVIELLILGKTYKELAEDLFVSQNTIKKHISNIYVKAKVSNKSELMYLILTEN